MRFFLGCDVEGCRNGLRWDDVYGVMLGGVMGAQVVGCPPLTFPLPPDWWAEELPGGDVRLLCEAHAPINARESVAQLPPGYGPGRYPIMRGRCGTCRNFPGVVCDLCGNGMRELTR